MYHYTGKDYALGVQHTLAMFGSTVLVPLITGMSPSVALFGAGVGTLLFHLCTKGIVPVFLGSSFAFIGAYCTIIGGNPANIPLAQGGIIASGIVYLLMALVSYLVGAERLRKIFPTIVTGPVIIIIGLSLAGVGVKDAFGFTGEPVFNMNALRNIIMALVTFDVIIIGMNRRKGLFQLIPVLIGIGVGYLLCLVLWKLGHFEMDFTAIKEAPWINVPYKNGFFTLPKFEIGPILLLAPISLVTFMEHIGDITTNGAVVGKDFFKDPGVHRTLMGDGLASIASGFFGGPANTTYSENTGVLATTRNYNPAILRLAAVFAIILGLLGKFGAFLLTIPAPIKGGVELMLFGMIAAIGVRTISEAKLDMTQPRNLSIMAAILCTGLGLGSLGGISLKFGDVPVNISALFVAMIVGVILNLVLPNPATEEAKK